MKDPMHPLFTVLKDLVLPPLNLVVLALIGWAIRRYWPRCGRALVRIAGLGLYLLATPYCSNLLIRSLQTAPVLTPERWDRTAGAIVVLGGGTYMSAPEYGGETVGYSSLERIRYGARL